MPSSLTLKNVTFQDACPYCGGPARTRNGTYVLVNMAVRAFTAPGVGKHQILELRTLAEGVRDGHIEKTKEGEEAAILSQTLRMLWNSLGANQVALLISIISIFLTIYSMNLSDDQEIKRQIDNSNQTQIQTRILQELQRSDSSSSDAVGPTKAARPVQAKVRTKPKARADRVNRHERRKAAALSKK